MTDLVTVARLLRDVIDRLDRLEAALCHYDDDSHEILSFAGDTYDDGNGGAVNQSGVVWSPPIEGR